MGIILRITGEQHRMLRDHLFPGDGYEAVSVGICGRHHATKHHILCLRRIVHVPYDDCSIRETDRVTWPTGQLNDLLDEATERGEAIVKFHSHPNGLDQFSLVDDKSDADLFASIHGWTDGEEPHVSVIMLPSGRMIARAVHTDGSFSPIARIAIAGDNIIFFDTDHDQGAVEKEQDRHARLFGESTTRLMRRLSVGVLGCSGTGGPLCEMLGRLGIGHLIAVDPDVVSFENLNRIPNSTRDDAEKSSLKVDIVARAVNSMGMGTVVVPIAENIAESTIAVRALAGCDVLFGCVDSAEGRHVLTKIATFYNIPYFDTGVKLEAGHGGRIDQVCGSVHYLQPGKSTLLDRGVYDMERVRAEGLRRRDPEEYHEQLRSNYIQGVDEIRPAVVTVNTLFAARAVNEFLARLHPYRLDDNIEFAVYSESLSQMERYHFREDRYDRALLAKYVGHGDIRPLLNSPELTEREVCS